MNETAVNSLTMFFLHLNICPSLLLLRLLSLTKVARGESEQRPQSREKKHLAPLSSRVIIY